MLKNNLISTLRRLFELLDASERKLIIFSMGIRVLLVAFDIVGLALLGISVALLSGSQVSPESWTGKAISIFANFGFTNVYAIFGLISVVFFVAKSLLAVGLNSWVLRAVSTMESRKATRIFSNLMQSDLDAKEGWSDAELSHGVKGSMDMAFGKALLAISVVISEAALILGVLVFLGFQDWLALLGVCLYFACIGWSMSAIVAKRNRDASMKIIDADLRLSNLVLQSISNFRQIVPSARSGFFIRRFEEDRQSLSLESAKISVISGLPRYITEIAMMLSLGALLMQRAIAPEMISSQTIGVFVIGSFRIIASMLPLQAAVTLLGQVSIDGKVAFEMSETLISREEGVEAHEAKRVNVGETPRLVLENLCFRYSQPGLGRLVLDDINLSIGFGEYVALTGRSGQGKSTLADLLLGLRAPTSGQVLIGGVDARDVKNANNGAVAYVPQESNFFKGTVAENISCVDIAEIDFEILDWVLDICSLRDWVNNLDNGVYSDLGQGKQLLSGGQKQRISLARALYQRPKILVLDEGTSALDGETEQELASALESLKGTLTVIAITHRGPLQALCDRSFNLSSSKLVEEY